MEYINLATAEDTQAYLESDYITEEEKSKLLQALENKETVYVMFDEKHENRLFVKSQSEIVVAFNKENKKANRNMILYTIIIIMFSLMCVMDIMNPEYSNGSYSRHTYLSIGLSGLLVVWYSITLFYTICLKRFLSRTLTYIKDNNTLPIQKEKVD